MWKLHKTLQRERSRYKRAKALIIINAKNDKEISVRRIPPLKLPEDFISAFPIREAQIREETAQSLIINRVHLAPAQIRREHLWGMGPYQIEEDSRRPPAPSLIGLTCQSALLQWKWLTLILWNVNFFLPSYSAAAHHADLGRWGGGGNTNHCM